jgi:hypothetical protein
MPKPQAHIQTHSLGVQQRGINAIAGRTGGQANQETAGGVHDLLLIPSGIALVFWSESTFDGPLPICIGATMSQRFDTPGEFSDAEKEKIVAKGKEIIAKARSNAAHLSTRKIQKLVNQAACNVRSRDAQTQ